MKYLMIAAALSIFAIQSEAGVLRSAKPVAFKAAKVSAKVLKTTAKVAYKVAY